MKLLIALIQQLIKELDNEFLAFFISHYNDIEINDAVCYIRSQGK